MAKSTGNGPKGKGPLPSKRRKIKQGAEKWAKYTVEQKIFVIKLHKDGKPFNKIRKLYHEKYGGALIPSSTLSSWYSQKKKIMSGISEFWGDFKTDKVTSSVTRVYNTQRPRILVDIEFFFIKIYQTVSAKWHKCDKKAIKIFGLKLYNKLKEMGLYDI